ncbi:protein phosphatase, caeel, putative [Talaromyces stipitatus ATCC 10500]|uniref:protein-serine/threonine phosphatase n=1 Tax=Talaromyces stipitatus (strain ATCC 10500 / CBS 375.48 / QM 6759 / NRRL 1006) TaxID=441959 RepID=B8MNY5_TALSN|nr:protein phosphatase, caeel, putative [Talaromyces stipitatus ATCC 10500]EED14224.1 protein phosphatase, caeel, putative [Talaromyces stipitatus ATCC 10500]
MLDKGKHKSTEVDVEPSIGLDSRLSITAIEPERRKATSSHAVNSWIALAYDILRFVIRDVAKPTSSHALKYHRQGKIPIKQRKEVDHVSDLPATGTVPEAASREGLASGPILANYNGNLPTNLDKAVLDDMIGRLPTSPGLSSRTLCLSNEEIITLCMVSRDIFLSQPVLLELKAPIKIVGGIYGMFDLCGYLSNANYLFPGDHVDRGKLGFFLLRGNYECANFTRVYGFYDECKCRCSLKIWKTFIDVFNCLLVAAIVSEKIVCVHGGLSPSLLTCMEDICVINGPTDIPEYGILNDLLWSGPADMKIIGRRTKVV